MNNIMTEFTYGAMDRTHTKKADIEICEDYLKLFVNEKQLRLRWKKVNSVVACDKDDQSLVPKPHNIYHFETVEEIENILDNIFGV